MRKPHFIWQLMKNGCGTVALLHAVINLSDVAGLYFPGGTFLSRFLRIAESGSNGEILGKFICEDLELEQIRSRYELQGKSNIDIDTKYHYITFVNLGGKIWELDGRRN